jgi:Phospholipid methyltransferase
MSFFSQLYRREIRGKLRVWLSWIFLPLIFGTIRQRPELGGILVVLAGGALRVWASGYLEKEGTALCEDGPYGFSRNPLYVGSILIALGIPLSQEYWLLSAFIAFVAVGLHILIIQEEEKVLVEKYPGYKEYCARVPRFFSPLGFFRQLFRAFLPPRPGQRTFSFRRWLHNKGYEPIFVAGGMVGVAFLVFLATLRR